MKLYGSIKELVAAVFRKDTKEIELRPNSSSYSGVTSPVVELPPPASGTVELVDKTSSQTLSGKSISGATNTLSSIPNNATTATDANTPSAIVARNASGNFSAGTITADLVGNASTATSATSATSFTGSLSGEVTGTQSATVVADNVIDNDNIKSTAAIAYSKLALTGSIVSADLAGSIDATKIGSGSVSSTEFGYLDGVTSSIQTQLGGKASSGANSDITSLSGLTTALSIGQGGTGATTPSTAINALLPAQGSSTGKYLKTNGTDVSWASASGGAGEINAVLNSSGADGTTGWLDDAPHSIAVSTATTIPLYPALTTAFTMSSSASVAIGAQNSSSGVYYEFTMPPALRNRKLKLEFYFNSPASADGTWGVAVYNGATKVRLSTDTGATPDTVLPAGVTGGKFTAYLDTDAGTTYRVNLVQRTRTITNNLVVTNVIVGPGIQPQGAVVGPYTSYAAVAGTHITGATTNPTLGTTTSNKVTITREGSFAFIEWTYVQTVAGNAGSGTYSFVLPAGLTIDTSITGVETTTVGAGGVGRFTITNGATDYDMAAYVATSTTIQARSAASGNWSSALTASNFAQTALRISLWVKVPINEWAGSGTVQLAQNDVEYASNKSTSTTTSDDGSSGNFAYGPGGAPIQSITAALIRRVRFQTPIQTGDRFDVELSTDQIKWQSMAFPFLNAGGTENIIPWTNQNGVQYGVGRIRIVNSTDIDITFGQYASNSSTYGAVGTSWSAAGGGSIYWRVRKSSAGAAVGFGIVSPGVSSGLVSASGLPGNTTGNAIASGFVGEVVGTLRSGTNGASYSTRSSIAPTTSESSLISVTLNKGVYLMSGYICCTNTVATYLQARVRIGGTAISDYPNVPISNTSNSTISFSVPVIISADSTSVDISGSIGTGTASGAKNELFIIRIA